MDGCAVTVRMAGDRAVVRLAGELDVASVDQVAARLARIDLAAVGGLSVDLTGLTFCDLTGYEAVEALRDRAHAAGVRFEILDDGLQPPVRRLLSLLPLPSVSAGAGA